MLIQSSAVQKALTNTLVGTGLKSIGSFTRLTDIPHDYQPLRSRTFKREAAVLGMTFAGGLLLEAAFSLIPPRFRKNPLVEFIPQAIAIYASEVLSRKMTNYSEALRESLEPQKPRLPQDVFTPQRFTPPLDAVQSRQMQPAGDVYFASKPQLSPQLKGFM